MRIFLGLAEVSGFYSNLAKGFKEIGIDAELVTISQHKFLYQDEHTSLIVKLAKFAVYRRTETRSKNIISKATWSFLVVLSRFILFVWAIIRFDVFIFGCSTTFFRFYELPILKLLGKKIIYNFHGTDSRCGFMDGFAEDIFMPQKFREGTGYIGPIRETDSKNLRTIKIGAYAKITAKRKANIVKIERYADVIINSPSHGQHHTRPFVQRLIVGMPYMPDRELLCKSKPQAKADSVTILHCPSYPEGKGTPQIRLAINRLKAKGYKINYVELTNRPNREVLEQLIKCDFVIDQLYSDMAMVGFATEAAFFGKPAIVGGYYSSCQSQDISSDWIPPTLFCLPEAIEIAIEKLISDIDFRKSLGKRAKDFVESRWLATRSAERMLSLIKGDFPKEWLYDPKDCDYILGMGLSRESLLEIVKGMFKNHGIMSFGLSDKPLLESKIREIVNAP